MRCRHHGFDNAVTPTNGNAILAASCVLLASSVGREQAWDLALNQLFFTQFSWFAHPRHHRPPSTVRAFASFRQA